MKAVAQAGLKNVLFLVSHKLVPPALRALLDRQAGQIDGFILPGHVSVIIGENHINFYRMSIKYHLVSLGLMG